jgi:DNA-binding MarR family transcriptional regulator
MEYDELMMYLLEMERMGLIRKHYDPESMEFLWELTPKGAAEKERLLEKEKRA